MRGSISFLITSLGYGGAPAQVVQLAIRLKQRGWTVEVISLIPPEAFTEDLAKAEIQLRSLNIQHKTPSIRPPWRLKAILQKNQPEILHCHMVHANLLGRVSRSLHRVPIILSTSHSINEGGKHRELAYRLTDRLSNMSTIISKNAAKHHVEKGMFPKHKLLVIPNGIDTAHFAPNAGTRKSIRAQLKAGNKFVWLSVGRFVEAKDYPNLLRAFKRVVSQHTDALLLIVGKGVLEEMIRDEIRELELEDSVQLLGTRLDIPQLMNAADAYAMSSAWEGLPMVLLEAASSGLPIVTTRVGGNDEVVIAGETGHLVPPKNPEALAQAMLSLTDSSQANRLMMGQKARQHVTSLYSFENVVNTWETLYTDLLASKGIRSG